MSRQTDVRIVLVRPRDPRNVGAACRAMKSMGITSLAIVPDDLLDPTQARILAHYAKDVLEKAVFHATLAGAVKDAVLVAGTTRRRGRNRKYFSIFPEQLGERIAGLGGGTVAVLFGNEETGLTDDELSLCHLAVTIPASPEFPSLNLSHAVQIICYAIHRARVAGHLTPFSPVSVAELDALASVITRSLKRIGFFHLVGPEQMGIFFKDILGRAGLSVNEAKRLGVTFRKIAGLITKKGIDPESNPP
ncbi:MAG TPA: TrmJ/YjtD family RNA methyltransferase [Spirochaetia bacterium]|nr:TrmJ/YjtD family RNA methyltransferase [Spirochaetia bacterium]